MRSIKTVLNQAGLNLLTAAFASLKLGTALSRLPVSVSLANPVSTSLFVLPNDLKAAAILAAYATAGSVTGRCTPVIGATPATHEVGIGPTGNIQFNVATDAVTTAQVDYIPEEGDVWTETISLTSNAGTFLSSKKSRLLLAATSTAGTLVGALTVIARGGSPTTGQVCLNAAGTGITTAAADAVTQASVTYVEFPTTGVIGAIKTALLSV